MRVTAKSDFMNTKNLLILTSRFPYEGGEYFLETESRYWREEKEINVYLMPFFSSKRIRMYPGWVKLRSENTDRNSKISRIKYLFAAFFSRLFFLELFRQYTTKKISTANAARALLILSRILQLKSAIKELSEEIGVIDVVYSYWNNVPAYSAALLKKNGVVRKVVTRAHGTDLYEHAHKDGYMPFKALVVDEFDLIAPVSDLGRSYYAERYAVPLSSVQVHRLGVEIDGRTSQASDPSSLSVVSISNCIDVKRVDVIAAGVLRFAEDHPYLKVRWVYIGDGDRLELLKEVWKKGSVGLENVEALFLGRLTNRDVLNYLAEHPCDVIVNASASEGVPVSIMEAMSFGIPAVAPRIGGIPELVSESSGYLLPPMPSPEQIAEGLVWAVESGKLASVRRAAAMQVAEHYAASKNYSNFYNLVLGEVL